MAEIESKVEILNPSYSPTFHTNNKNKPSIHESWPSSFKRGVDCSLSPLGARRKSGLSTRATESSPFLTVSSPYAEKRMPNYSSPERPESSETNASSVAMATFNAVNLLLGVGVLSLPFALRSSGYLVGLPLLFFFSLATNHTGKLLGKCLEYEPGMRTYPDIGEAAYGRRGRIIISIIFFTELFTACTMFLVLVGDNMHTLFPSMPESTMMMIGFLCILPTTWTSHLSILSYFSVIGVVSSILLCLSLFYIGFEATGDGSLTHPQRTEFIADADRIPLAIGLTMVGFAGHAVFPSIYESLSDRSKYPKVLDVTYFVAFSVYGAIAVAGYLMYGLDTQQEITLNLMKSNSGWISTAITWIIVFNPASKYALALNPVALSLEELVFSKKTISSQKPVNCFLRGLLRSSIAFGTLICAVYVPYFARLTSFLGALFAMFVSVVFPCVCYVKLFYARLPSWEISLNIIIVVFSCIFGIIGTLAAFISPTE